MIVAFGFNMQKREPDPHVISWCDPSGEWEPQATNQAGWNILPYFIVPEFILEHGDKIIAYQPGRCIVMHYTGDPFVWSFTTMTADEPYKSQITA